MKEINIDEVKEIQLDILAAVDEFCSKNGIRYSLSSGTLIGAVRHNGYIPWDDDIDIMMPRADYDRFINIFNGSYKHLTLIAPEHNLEYYAPYANVFDNRTLLTEGDNGHRGFNIGIKIDVFPIDYVSEDLKRYNKELSITKYINYILYIKRLKNPLRNNKGLSHFVTLLIEKMICFWLPYRFLQKIIILIANNKKYQGSSYVDNVVFNVYTSKSPRFNSLIMDSYTRINFEGYKFNIVTNYDEVLTKMYGDYMQLPPEEERVAHHNFKACWIE